MKSSVSTRTSSPFLGETRPLLGKVRAPSFGAVAQLAERLHGMQEVRGSIPLSSTNDRGCPFDEGLRVSSELFYCLN